MSSLLSAELAATCNALGYYDAKSSKYYADSNTLETVKDLIRYLRRDGETHDIRRQLGESKVLQTDLLPLLKSYWEETELFDVLLRLLVNLSTPALMLWNEEPPAEKNKRNYYLQIEGHLEGYKQAFADENVWAVLSTRLSQILEIDYAERGDENSLIIERILILIRNVLYVIPDPNKEKRTDNDASVHDQVLWALQQSGMLDIILFLTSSTNERAYYMHALEILSFMLREQSPSELASAALQRSELEKIRDEAELLAIRNRETDKRRQKLKVYSGARHSRFGGTYVLKSIKSISDNELIYHRPLNKLDVLDFDSDKKKQKTPKNRLPVKGSTLERRSAFSVRLFLKEFCVEFLNGAYNTLMYHVKDGLVRAKAQAHDESYYLWALKFFMEFNRRYKFEVKLVSETMSLQSFHYVQQQIEQYFEIMQTDKKKTTIWSRRLHLALAAYRELLLTLCAMDKSDDAGVRDSSKVIKSNIFYVPEYRELVITLLLNYDELKMSNAYLNDLMETQHVFIKMLESFGGAGGSVMVAAQKKGRSRKKKTNKRVARSGTVQTQKSSLEDLWEEAAPQLSSVLEGGLRVNVDVVPFDAASDVPIDEQKSEAMRNVQRKLRDNELEEAIALLRAAREVWPENDCFGSSDMPPEEEFLALRDIFFADLGDVEGPAEVVEEVVDNDSEDEEEDDGGTSFVESDFQFKDFAKRLCNPKIVRACGLALRNFETNPINTNQCIVKLLHRIAFDCQMYVMIFQVSLFKTFQKIYANKYLPQHRELAKFATFIIRKFLAVTQSNKKVYLETLFWKTSTEAFDIENGYGSFAKRNISVAWTEEQEDELRRLFVEHEQNRVDEDVVDWIVSNLIDNTRTRRGVLKKLKQMHLLINYKGPRKSGAAVRAPRQWGAEEEEELRQLFPECKELDDPIDSLIERLPVQRSRQKIVEKLLELGLIQDKKEVRKKKPSKSRPNRDSDSGSADDSSENEDNTRSTHNKKKPTTFSASSRKPSKPGKPRRKNVPKFPNGDLIKLLLEIVNAGMEDAVQWLQECFSDAMDDFEADPDGESIPLVPIMDYAVDAMENERFQKLLKGMGIVEPFEEQEMYWRVPSELSLDDLKQRHELLQQAINKTLTEQPTLPAPPQDVEESSDDEYVFNQLRSFTRKESEAGPSTQELKESITQSRAILKSEEQDKENVDINRPSTSYYVPSKRTSPQKNIESDEDEDDNFTGRYSTRRLISDDEDGKRHRSDSDSNEERPVAKRAKKVTKKKPSTQELKESITHSTALLELPRRDEDVDNINTTSANSLSKEMSPVRSNVEEEEDNTSSKKVARGKLLISDDEDPDRQQTGIESDSDTRKPLAKRTRRIVSSDED